MYKCGLLINKEYTIKTYTYSIRTITSVYSNFQLNSHPVF